MNKLMKYWTMAEAGQPGGGASPVQEQTNADAPAAAERPNADTAPDGEAQKSVVSTADVPNTEPSQTQEPPNEPVNLMDDETEQKPDEAQTKPVEAQGPSDEDRKAFVDAVKKIDIGEGVQWDDPALEAIAPSLMEITGGDASKTDKLVRAYTAFQQQKAREYQQANDKFLNGLVDQCRTRFGADLPKVVALAKAGGRKIFGDRMWDVMKRERAFANNPDIIEKLAAVGRTATDDPGVVKKETANAPVKRDWRENMYGRHN